MVNAPSTRSASTHPIARCSDLDGAKRDQWPCGHRTDPGVERDGPTVSGFKKAPTPAHGAPGRCRRWPARASAARTTVRPAPPSRACPSGPPSPDVRPPEARWSLVARAGTWALQQRRSSGLRSPLTRPGRRWAPVARFVARLGVARSRLRTPRPRGRIRQWRQPHADGGRERGSAPVRRALATRPPRSEAHLRRSGVGRRLCPPRN
jgi:hypothetical protein